MHLYWKALLSIKAVFVPRGFLNISEENTGSAESAKVTVLSGRPIMHVTNVRASGITVNLYGFIDLPPFCSVWFTKALSFMPTASHKYFLESAAPLRFSRRLSPIRFMWLASSFDWACFVPLVPAQLISVIAAALTPSSTRTLLERLFVVKIVI